MRVSSIAANIANDAQLAIRRSQALLVDKRWDWLGEVDTVDEDV